MPLKATISQRSSTRASVGQGRFVGYGASSAPRSTRSVPNTGNRARSPRRPSRPSLASTSSSSSTRSSVVPSVARRSGAAATRVRSSSDGPAASAGWNRKNRLALTKPTSHRSPSRTRCGSHTATEVKPSVGSGSSVVSSTCSPWRRSTEPSTRRQRHPQRRRAVAGRARRRLLEVAPRAGRHQPPVAVAHDVGGVVAVRAGTVGPAEEQVCGVPQVQRVGGEPPQAGVAAVEEAGSGRRGAQPQVPAVAHGAAVGVADEPQVAQPELAEASGRRGLRRQLDLAGRRGRHGRGRRGVAPSRRGVVAHVPPRPGDPSALLAGPGREVVAGQGEPELGRRLGPRHPAAPVLARAPAHGDRERDRRAVVRHPQPRPVEVQGEQGLRRRGGQGRRRRDVRREGRQRVPPALVGADPGPGDQLDRTQPAHDLEAGQHRAIVAAGAAPPVERRAARDQLSDIRGSPPTSPVPAMVHWPLRTAPPFQAWRTHERVAICAQ